MKTHCKATATALLTSSLLLLASSFSLLPSSFAKTFDWPIDSPAAGARQFTAYHGETVRFNLQFRGAMTNLSPVAIYYQTNGMGKAEWFEPIPGTVFHPTNDCGAASYRFFIRCTDPDGINYTANGSLRLLDSPGFVPNELPFPARVLDFSAIDVRNPPWPDESDIETVATNAAVRATSGIFRPFGDEYVYESTGMGDFTYTSDRSDIVEALGGTQPYAWEDGDYVEYYFDEIYADGRYWWGNAYTTKNSPVVTFWFHSDYWDDETGDYFYDEVEVVGTRQPGGWDRTDPVDTFAHQSELTSINSSITSLRNTLNGETKVLRTGQTGEYGSGWGYVQRMMDSELRKWRIRVPKFGSTTGMTTNSTAATASYRTVDNPVAPSPVQYYTPKVLTAPHTWMPGWGCYRRLAETRGVYGTDAVSLADYRVGLLATGTDSYVLDYIVTHTNRSPMCFNVQAATNGMSRLMVAKDAVQASRRAAYVRYVDYPQLHFRWQTDGNSTYTVTNENWLTLKAVGVYGDAAAASTSNGTIPLSFICVFDAELRSEQRTKSSGAVTVRTASATNVLTTATVTLSCTSATTLEDVYVPYYRLVTTHGDENNFYYDAAQNRTWRIAVSNGCFYSEWVMDGDWRRRGL